MENGNSPVVQEIEKRFQEIGGFTWEQAETWAGFCNAVGMDPLPFLKVILHNICEVKYPAGGGCLPSDAECPELRVIFKACRTRFEVVEP